MGFDEGFDKIIWKKLGNFSIFLDTSFHCTLFLFKHIVNTHIHTQTLKKKKKKRPEILVTPHVVFICEK